MSPEAQAAIAEIAQAEIKRLTTIAEPATAVVGPRYAVSAADYHRPQARPRRAPMPDGKCCKICGGLVVQTGTCETCTSCGDNSGCG